MAHPKPREYSEGSVMVEYYPADPYPYRVAVGIESISMDRKEVLILYKLLTKLLARKDK